MLNAVFNNTHTVINVFSSLQMYAYWDLEEISILDNWISSLYIVNIYISISFAQKHVWF